MGSVNCIVFFVQKVRVFAPKIEFSSVFARTAQASAIISWSEVDFCPKKLLSLTQSVFVFLQKAGFVTFQWLSVSGRQNLQFLSIRTHFHFVYHVFVVLSRKTESVFGWVDVLLRKDCIVTALKLLRTKSWFYFLSEMSQKEVQVSTLSFKKFALFKGKRKSNSFS